MDKEHPVLLVSDGSLPSDREMAEYLARTSKTVEFWLAWLKEIDK